MISDTSGFRNTAVGWRTLRYNLQGWDNTAIGVGALEFMPQQTGNTALGRGAMINAAGDYNIAVGYYAAGYGYCPE